MLHCRCTTDICIFMENVSIFDIFSKSPKLNLPRDWVFCLWDILKGVTQQVLQQALGITMLPNLHEPGLFLALCQSNVPLFRCWQQEWLGSVPCRSCPPLARCCRGSPCAGAALWEPRWAGLRLGSAFPAVPAPLSPAAPQPAFPKEWPTLLSQLNNSPSQWDQVWV